MRKEKEGQDDASP